MIKTPLKIPVGTPPLAASTPAQVKPPSKQMVVPKYLSGARNSVIASPIIDTTSLDRAASARSAGSLNAVIANLARVSPDVSQAIATKISSAISRTYTVIAFAQDGLVDIEATTIAQGLVLKFETQASDYTKFFHSTDLRSISATLLLDLLRYGSMAAELVLDKLRQPAKIYPFSTADLKWATDAPNSYPIYNNTPLNYPTIFYSVSAQDSSSVYSNAPLEACIQPALWDMEFVDTLRKAAIKNLLQRLVVTINSDKFRTSLPIDVQADSTKFNAAISSTIAAVESQLNALNPEDALVLFDNLTAGTIADANRSEDKTIGALRSLIDGKLSSGAKILPSIIGRGESSSSASSESQLFMKSISTMQLELNTFFSRIFTLAVKLLGYDASVRFSYSEVNLRPELELESFKSVKQARILDQLSLGLISDVEASIELTGTLPPAGYKNLSGTYFKVGPVDTKQNSYSNTSATADENPDSTQIVKDTTSGAPAGVPGRNSK